MNMITDRYASAVNSHSLTVDPRTTMSDTDVLAAMGWASRQVPMAVALERLFAGDSTAANVIAAILAQQAFEYSFRIETKISRLQCADMAKACLAWHRNGAVDPAEATARHSSPARRDCQTMTVGCAEVLG